MKYILFIIRALTLILIMFLFGFSNIAKGQTTIVSEDFENTSVHFDIVNTGTAAAFYSGNSGTSDLPASSPLAITGNYSFGVGATGEGTGNKTILSTLTSLFDINTTGYSNLTLSLRAAAFGLNSTDAGIESMDYIKIGISTDGGSNYTDYLTVEGYSTASQNRWAYAATGIATTTYGTNATFAPAGIGTRTSDGYSTLTITSLPSITNLRVRITIYNASTTSNRERWNIDDFKITGTPLITTGAVSSSPFCVTASSGASGTVAYASIGTYTDATFTARLSDTEGSFTNAVDIGTASVTGTDPTGSINITIPSGTSSGAGYKIRIDCTSPAITGSESSAIEIINGVSDVTSASAIASSTTVALSWTNPISCYSEIMIVAKAFSATSNTPNGDGTEYTADLAFGTTGTEFGTNDGYVVYKGTTSPQTVTGLTNGTTYYFTFFTRNGSTWSTGTTVFASPFEISTGSYQSYQTGEWGSLTTWRRWDGDSWEEPTSGEGTPTDASGPVSILSSHTVTIAASVSADQVVVESGGNVIVNNVTLTITDGTGNDFVVDGTIELTGTSGVITTTGNLIFNGGGTYIHNRNGGTIPTATWAATSNCNITGVTTTEPTTSSFAQSFGNFTWNCTSQSGEIDLNGQLTSISGNFNVISTGPTTSDYVQLGGSTSGNLTVGANYSQTGGIFILTGNTGSGAIDRTMLVNGDFSVTSASRFLISSVTGAGTLNVGGNFTFSSVNTFAITYTQNLPGTINIAGNCSISTGTYFYTSRGAGVGTLNVAGNFSHTSGTIQNTGSTTTGGIFFNGTGTQTYLSGGSISGTINFTVNNGSVLQIGANQLLTATTLTNAGTLTIDPLGKATAITLSNSGTLNLNSDATGIASLKFNSYSGSGTNNIQLYLTGDGTGTLWHYVSPPVTSVSPALFTAKASTAVAEYQENLISDNMNNGWVTSLGYHYNTATSLWESGSSWVYGSNLVPGRGYDYYSTTPTSTPFNITGSMNYNDITLPLSYHSGGGTEYPDQQGFNLAGNPFTCSLDWDLVVSDASNSSIWTSVEAAIYFRRNGTLYTYTSSTGTTVPNDFGDGGQIPPMQGFFIKATAGATLTIPAAAKIHSAHARYKGNPSVPLIRLQLDNSGKTDQTVIGFDEKATLSYDNLFDARKLFAPAEAPYIYSSLEGIKYAINAIQFPDKSVAIPLVINASSDGSFTIKATQIDGLDNYKVYLLDKNLNYTTELSVDKPYTFTSSTGIVTDRFILTVTNIITGIPETNVTAKLFNIYSSGNMINIQTLSDDWNGRQGEIKVLDLTGRLISISGNIEFTKDEIRQIPAKDASGIYIVRIVSGKMEFTDKVMIK